MHFVGVESQQLAVDAKEEKERHDRISKLGLALLILGFVFQLVATWL